MSATEFDVKRSILQPFAVEWAPREGIAIDDVLRLLRDCHASGEARVVVRIADEEFGSQWREIAATTMAMLDSGDLLITAASGDHALADLRDAVRLEEMATLANFGRTHPDDRRLWLSLDDGERVLICNGAFVPDVAPCLVYLTFLPMSILPPRQHFAMH